VGREMGVTEEQLRDLPRYRESQAFSEEERLVIELAVEMTGSAVKIPPNSRRGYDGTSTSPSSWSWLRISLGRTTGLASTACSGCDRSASPKALTV
jgi:hypothetical protein